MPRKWVIAPYSNVPDVWEKIWRYDLANGVISIGWNELGDISRFDENELRAAMERAYEGNTRSFNMLWDFYHNIQVGDVIIARKGRKRIAGVGTVREPAHYRENGNLQAVGGEHAHSNYLGVRWDDSPRDKDFDRVVFPIQTIWEIDEATYQELIGNAADSLTAAVASGVENPVEFVLEKYLQDFIVSNFQAIFRGELNFYTETRKKVSLPANTQSKEGELIFSRKSQAQIASW